MGDPDKCMGNTSGGARTCSPCDRSEVNGGPILDSFLKKFRT